MSFVEAQQGLLSVITLMKDTIADPEKHMGRFTREDKVCFVILFLFACIGNILQAAVYPISDVHKHAAHSSSQAKVCQSYNIAKIIIASHFHGFHHAGLRLSP